MKRIISSILLFYTSLLLFAGNEQIAISVKRHGGAHSEYYLPADMPEMYYDSDCNEIIIVADGFAGYYYVDFYLTGYTTPLISTQVEGYGDSINVSNLPVGDYTVVITSEYNNQYEGQLTIE